MNEYHDDIKFEPPHKKTNNMHRRKRRRGSAVMERKAVPKQVTMDLPTIYYHLDESTVIVRGIGSDFEFNPLNKQNETQMERRVLRCHIWGYTVCPSPIKRTPGL